MRRWAVRGRADGTLLTESAAELPYPRDDEAALHSCAAALDGGARRADRLRSTLLSHQQSVPSTWSGPAATSCLREVGALYALLGRLSESLTRAGHVLARHAEVVTASKSAIDRLREIHESLGQSERAARLAFDSWADPQAVGVSAAVERLRADRLAELGHEVAVLRQRHGEELSAVRASATRAAAALVEAASGLAPAGRSGRAGLRAGEVALANALPLLAAARAVVGVGHGPPAPDASPDRVRLWWAAMTSDEQQRAIERWPRRLGDLGGLPAVARSRANERVLARRLTALSAALPSMAMVHLLTVCLRTKEALDAARSRPGGRASSLLVFRPAAFEGAGRVAIGVGDLDSAEHVAVLVPGMGTTVVGSLASLTTAASRLRTEAARADGASRTAVLAWVGYETPRAVGVVTGHAADSGAALLAADLSALRASSAEQPHVTVVGHSYGSTTVGHTLRSGDVGVDDVVLVGSPGAGVSEARDLAVARGHVFAGAASRDPVSYLAHHGPDPTDDDFGAVRFAAESLRRDPAGVNLADHSRYYDADSESLLNIARIVTSQHDDVVLAPYRGDRFGPDGIRTDPEAVREPTSGR